jgi:multiple sugar transport system substrate-binding protein
VKKEFARELLCFLTAPEQQTLEARHGSVPVRRQVMAEQQEAARGDEADRMALLANAIEHDLIIPPKLPYYPEIEDILWRNVRSAMTGETAIADALVEIERRIGRAKAHR